MKYKPDDIRFYALGPTQGRCTMILYIVVGLVLTLPMGTMGVGFYFAIQVRPSTHRSGLPLNVSCDCGRRGQALSGTINPGPNPTFGSFLCVNHPGRHHPKPHRRVAIRWQLRANRISSSYDSSSDAE